MRRWAVVLACLCIALTTTTLRAAESGITAPERKRALEFHKRLTADLVSPALAKAMTFSYLRWAYLFDEEPASALAKMVLEEQLDFSEREQAAHFELCIGAFARGAQLQDIKTTLNEIVQGTYNKSDTAFFLESFLGAASHQASPAALANLTAMVSNNGMVGSRRREFMTWVLDHVRGGEDPEHILAIYDAIDNVMFSIGAQRNYLTTCYDAVRRGVPPLALSKTVARMSEQFDTARDIEQSTDRIFDLYFRQGMAFDEAVDEALPPVRKLADDEEGF